MISFLFSLLSSILLFPSILFSTTYEMHGVKIEDPYCFLEEMESEKTLAWLDAQEKKANEYFSQLDNRSQIYKKLEKNARFDKLGVPSEVGDCLVYTFQAKDQDKKMLIFENEKGEETVIVNPNTFKNKENVSLSNYVISPNGKVLAYALTTSGMDFITWHFYDLENMKPYETSISKTKFATLSFDENSEGVFYTKWHRSSMSKQDECLGIYYHGLNQKKEDNDFLALDAKEMPNHFFFPGPVIANGRYLVVSTLDNHHCDKEGLLFINLLDFSFKEIIPSKLANFNFIEEKEDQIFLQTSYNAPKQKVIALEIENPSLENAQTIIKESNNQLTQVTSSQDYLIAHYLDDCKSKVIFFDYLGNKRHEMPLNEPCFIGLPSHPSYLETYKDNAFYFAKSNFTTPYSINCYDIEDQRIDLVFSPVEQNNDIVTKQVFFESKDGTKVPMFIISKKDVSLDGNQPTLMWGYGGFGVPVLPYYFQEVSTWVEMGGIYVVVNLRGGSEYGMSWHEQGRLHNKQNVFDDFISAGEYLVNHNYTCPQKLAITGGSNGGLLVGACLIQRPDLFGAAVPVVGVLDMLKFHKYTSGQSWISDYGNPDNLDDFKILHSYSPYHNVKAGVKYPPTLIMTSDHDDRVVPMHSYKFTAMLQNAMGDPNKVILRLGRAQGHGAGGSFSKELENKSDMLTFLSDQLKMEKSLN